MPWLRFVWALALLSSGFARAAVVVYLVVPGTSPQAKQQIATAAHFYGLELTTEIVADDRSAREALAAVAQQKTIAVAIDAVALTSIDRTRLLAATSRPHGSVPVLVAAINGRTPSADLRLWSGGAVSTCRVCPTSGGWEQVGPPGEITRQLAGARLPLGVQPVAALDVSDAGHTEELITLKGAGSSRPLFVRVRSSRQDLFFATEFRPLDVAVSPDPFREQAVFAALAPTMLFLHHAAGDRAWHSPGPYANFTIDDLWLREPYGHVSYRQLLEESQRHNFHTTIAFIPWNFDRSRPEVVSLFRDHPDRLSIAVHGNDHLHQEFGPIASHPLPEQEHNIAQSLARMRRFQELTGLAYDPVMVFPHSVSPAATFSALKEANFLGTINSLNVPSDRSAPPDIDFALRSVTLDFSNFPSVRRYSAENDIPEAQLAIDAFLGNPLLFYAHESFFASGDTAFNGVADVVNRLQPGVRWTGLGEIMRHLYLERSGDDGQVVVRAFSPSILLRNSTHEAVQYRIQKEENFASPVTVLINGQKTAYERKENDLALSLTIPAGEERLVDIRYPGANGVEGMDLRSHSATVGVTRLLSDFRDDSVSRTAAGRWFIRSYADSGTMWNRVVAIVVTCLGLLMAAVCCKRVLRRAEHDAPGRST